MKRTAASFRSLLRHVSEMAVLPLCMLLTLLLFLLLLFLATTVTPGLNTKTGAKLSNLSPWQEKIGHRLYN